MTEEQKKILVEEIKLQRFKKKKSQEDCAKALGISVPTYRELEYNPGKIDLNQAFILADFLEWNLFEFFLEAILRNAIEN